jgi:Retrotransposon gag protein
MLRSSKYTNRHFEFLTKHMNASVNPCIVFASSVDGIQTVRDIWVNLKRTYVRTENHMRVFQIQRDIDAVVLGDKSIQEYVIFLKRMWADLNHFSLMSSCSDPECEKRKIFAQGRTMKFLGGLSPAFDQRRSVLLA